LGAALRSPCRGSRAGKTPRRDAPRSPPPARVAAPLVPLRLAAHEPRPVRQATPDTLPAEWPISREFLAGRGHREPPVFHPLRADQSVSHGPYLAALALYVQPLDAVIVLMLHVLRGEEQLLTVVLGEV